MFGISAAVVVAGAGVAATLYTADRQRKALHQQQDAIKAQQEEDARKAAEADTQAAVAANAQTIDSKRRKRESALELGNPAGTYDVLGAGGSALAAGGPTPASRAASGYAGYAPGGAGGTALGAGVGAGPRATTPAKPSRALSK